MTNCNGNSGCDFDGIACKVDCPALAKLNNGFKNITWENDEEVGRADFLVDDDLPKISPHLTEDSGVQTANVHEEPQDTTQTFATREGSLYVSTPIASTELIESEQSALKSYPDSDDQYYTRESNFSTVANDKLTRIEGFESDMKLEIVSYPEPTSQRRRISFVCLASILSEVSFDSLEDDK
eukprot:CAMPEP_0198255226 /NCGR_PEP_ID=MMETSP1447-20131203/5390_1 /TAXON_ID=420782 /ORGANISM="Chaetoceros dichaeta, Strain CCMP1751" /LENGTH=181 /DNA_ID=CAMNT_0043941545 /DNA_START=679 /DNA_END=1224 /DNA_ORIENTATION=-